VRISCVKCSTLYELDDRLIPPGGAPVQCTRCGSVFTAKPAGPAPAPSVAQSPAAQPRSATQVFGAVKADASGGARAATQIFGASFGQPSSGRGGPAPTAGAASPVATFSSSRSGAPRPAPQRAAPSSASGAAPASPGTPILESMEPPVAAGRTQIFGQPFGSPSAPNTSRGAAAHEAPDTVKLPPEEPAWATAKSQRRGGSVELPDAKPLFGIAPREAGGMSFTVEETSGTRRFFVVALVVIAIATPSFFAVRAVLKRRSSVPSEVLRGEESAMGLLRRDDRASRKQAIADLDSLAKKYPSAVGPAATRLLALSLDLDDVRLAASRLQSQVDEATRAATRAQDQRTVEGAAQIAAAQGQIAALNKEIQPLLDEQKTLDQQVATAFGSLMMMSTARRGAEDAGSIRAQAVYYGVKGVDKADVLARSYRELGTKDGWDAVALAEFAINAPAAPASSPEGLRRCFHRARCGGGAQSLPSDGSPIDRLGGRSQAQRPHSLDPGRHRASR